MNSKVSVETKRSFILIEFGSAIVLPIHDCVPMSTTSPVRVGGEVSHECVGTLLSQYYDSAMPFHISFLDG